jgi:hypothetical protein
VTTWAIVVVFLTCAIAAIAFLNAALRLGTALFIIPVYYVMSTLLAITGGLVYFENYKEVGL